MADKKRPKLVDVLTCEVCGALLPDWSCVNDGDRNHDRIQDELWEERNVRG